MFEPVANRRAILGQALYASIWLAITGFGIYLNPSPVGHGTHQELGLPPCPCVLFFNRPCPGCGLTTSFTALIHGRFREAFHAHWLGPLLYLIFTATAVLAGIGFVRGKRFNAHTRGFQNFLLAFTIVFIAYGAIRFAVTPHYQSTYESMVAAQLKGK